MIVASRSLSGVLLLIIAILTGCSSENVHPVQGQVVWKDTKQPATELKGSLISFEQPATETSARGQIQADGSFQLTTVNENDGAKLGEHTVLIIEIGRRSIGGADGSRLEPGKIAIRYATPSTSELRTVVQKGLNKPVLEVDRFER